jgi:hypothetical protein
MSMYHFESWQKRDALIEDTSKDETARLKDEVTICSLLPYLFFSSLSR